MATQLLEQRAQSVKFSALSSLGDSHRLGYVALTLAVQRLEKRVKELEQRR